VKEKPMVSYMLINKISYKLKIDQMLEI